MVGAQRRNKGRPERTLVIPNGILEAWRIYLPYTEWTKKYKEIIKNQTGIKTATLGRFVITLVSQYNVKKYIVEERTEEVAGHKLAYSEIARSILYTLEEEGILKRKRKKGIFAFKAEDYRQMKNNYPALFAKAGKYADMVYVDIRAFYFNIYRRTFVVEYQAGRRFHVVRELPAWAQEYLKERKKVRNVLFGIMATRIGKQIRNGKLIAGYTVNKYLNPQLVNLAWDTGHAIAYKAIQEFGAVYYHTDGAIIPAGKYEKFKEFIESMGFEISIKVAGDVEIKGIGVYKFQTEDGEIKTKNWADRMRYKEFSNIRGDEYADWLIKCWKVITKT